MLTTTNPSHEARKRRRAIRALTVLIITTATVLATVGIAVAKGPQSATITGPGIDQPIELMDNAGPEPMSRLMEQTGIWYGTGDLPLPLDEPVGKLGPAYTLTWISSGPPSDTVDKRTIIQMIYLDPENDPIIHTPGQGSLDGWGSEVAGWFAAPIGLRQTLEDLGVPVSATPYLNQPLPAENAVDTSPSEGEVAESGAGAGWAAQKEGRLVNNPLGSDLPCSGAAFFSTAGYLLTELPDLGERRPRQAPITRESAQDYTHVLPGAPQSP